MKLENFFFIHIPKTGGTFVAKSIPNLTLSKHYDLPTHATYSDCKYHLDNKIVFSVVRNPYDWLESFYFYEHTRSKVKKRNPEILKYKTFDKFVYEKGFINLGPRQHEYLHRNIPLENILRTESLNLMLKKFFGKYGKDISVPNEKIRVNHLKSKINWTEEMKDLVQTYYKDDFELFGYSK